MTKKPIEQDNVKPVPVSGIGFKKGGVLHSLFEAFAELERERLERKRDRDRDRDRELER
jgi:hypothetical protein